jgi:hypothetical protein
MLRPMLVLLDSGGRRDRASDFGRSVHGDGASGKFDKFIQWLETALKMSVKNYGDWIDAIGDRNRE